MLKVHVIILYPFDIQEGKKKESLLMLKSLLYELDACEKFSVHNSTIHILSDGKDKVELEEILSQLNPQITIHFLGDTTFTDWDMMNHHLNVHVQRAMVSTDADYFLVLSGILPIFQHKIFTEEVNWESDINLGVAQDSSTAMILFKKQFTPFFFKLTNDSIITGDRNITLFQQYKRNSTVILHSCLNTLDKGNPAIYDEILNDLKGVLNPYQKELYRVLKSSSL